MSVSLYSRDGFLLDLTPIGTNIQTHRLSGLVVANVYKGDSLHFDTSPYELHVTLESIHKLQTTMDFTASRGTFDMERTAPQNTLSS